MIGTHIALPQVSSLHIPESLHQCIAASPDEAVGKHIMDAQYKPDKTANNRRQELLAASRAHAEHSKGPAPQDVPALELAVRQHPTLAAFLKPTAAKVINRSVFQENVEKLKTIAENHDTAAANAEAEAIAADENLRSKLHCAGVSDNEIEKYFPKDGKAVYMKEDGKRSNFPDEIFNNTPLDQQAKCKDAFESVQDHLHKAEILKADAAKAREHLHINNTLHETMRHWSYRGLFRIVNASMRKQMTDWLNLIGMLTMVATMPLMYESFKQWIDSFHQPQGGSGQ